MSYPPTTLATSRTNDTLVEDVHPADHNDANGAVNDIVTELGANPSGARANVQTRLVTIGAVLKTDLENQTSTPAADTFVEVASVSGEQIYVSKVRAGVRASALTDATGRLRITEIDSAGTESTTDVDSAATGATDLMINASMAHPTVGDVFPTLAWAAAEAAQNLGQRLTTGRRVKKVALWVKRNNVTDPVTWTFQALGAELG